MERFKIYSILHHDHLSQVSLTVNDNTPYLKHLFDQLSERAVKVKSLVLQKQAEKSLTLTFYVEKADLGVIKKILSNLPLSEEDVHLNPEVGTVAIYGPHFVEKPGIIDTMYHALSSRGVEILAISATVSTSLFVIPAPQVDRATELLKEAFEIPRGKV
jgi:aspartokinase